MATSVQALLESLIRCESITPNDAGCQEIVGKELGEAGFQLQTLNHGGVTNLWATHGSTRPLVCLAGHTDVVPPGPREAWSGDPFEPRIEEGQLIGRGTSDMKASVAAMTCAAIKLAEEGHPGTVAILLTSDEEGPGVYGTRYVLEQLSAMGVHIDFGIVGEPTSEGVFGDTIKNGRRGSLNGKCRVSGIQGHTAYPHLADNAIHRLAPVLAELTAIDWGPADVDFPATTLQVCNLRAGTGATNVIPGQCEVDFNVRFGVRYTVERIKERIREVFDQGQISDPIEWQASALPFLNQSEALVNALSQAIETQTGQVPKLSTGGGTSDARFFAAQGIPVSEFGPLNATIHAANERVELACLEPLVEIYAAAVRNLLQHDANDAS